MILVKEVVGQGLVLLATGQYQDLKHSTDAISGFATLSVKIRQSISPSNAGVVWRGRKLVHMSKDGMLWEGRIERAATDGEWVTVECVGEGPAILTRDSYAYLVYDNTLSGSGEWSQIHDQEPDEDGKETSTKFILQADEVSMELGIKAGPTPRDEEAWKDNLEYSTLAALVAAGWDAIGTPAGTGPSGSGPWDGSWVYGNIMGGAEDNHTYGRNVYMNQGGGTPGYYNNENSAFWSPVINLSAYAGRVENFTLKWWSRIVTVDANDWGDVQVSKDNGANWTTVAGPFSGNAVPDWTEYEVTLDATHAVSQLRLRWRLVANATSQMVGGWRMDDVSITAHFLEKQTILQNERTYLHWQNPAVWSGASGIRWARVEYQIVSTQANLRFQVHIHGDGGYEATPVDVAVTAGSVQTVTWSDALARGRHVHFQLIAVGGDAIHYDNDSIFVKVTKFERSQVSTSPPGVKDALKQVFIDAGVPTMFPAYLSPPNTLITRPTILKPGSTFKQAIDEIVKVFALTGSAGKEWIYGVWDGGLFNLTDVPRRTWKVGEKEAGTASLHSVLGAGSQSIGRATSTSYSHVRARYLALEDDFDEVRFTTKKATGIDVGYERVMEIDAGKVTLAEADALALREAEKLLESSPRGTITLRGSARTVEGGIYPVSTIRAGDWLFLDAVSATRTLKREDVQRGGFIGKTTYSDETGEVVLELLGNFNE